MEEAILDFREGNEKIGIEIVRKFIDENIGNIKSFVIMMDECSESSFEFIENIFERSSNIVTNLKLDFSFESKNDLIQRSEQFLSKFVNLKCLSLILPDISRYYLDWILQDLDDAQFKELKKFEFAIRSYGIFFPHLEKLQEIIQVMKPTLEELKLEILFLYSSPEDIWNRFIQSLEGIPIIYLRWKLNISILESIISLSEKCKDLSLRFDRCCNTTPLILEGTMNLSKLELLDLLSWAKFDSSVKELKISCFCSHYFLQQNKFDNLRVLEIADMVSVKGKNLFPSLEYVRCTNCQFRHGIDLFTSCRKLKSLIFTWCLIGRTDNTKLECKDLEELNITTSNPIDINLAILKGLKLKKLTIWLKSNISEIDLLPIEEMSSLQYLKLGEYYEHFSFEKLTNLKYLEFGKTWILNTIPLKSANLLCEHLMRNCVIYFSSISIEEGHSMPFPILSETGKFKIDRSMCKLIALKLSELEIGVKGVKFIFISDQYIYVGFNRQSKNRHYSYPSFILFERNSPHSTLAYERSYEKKQELLELTLEYLMKMNLNSTETTVSVPPTHSKQKNCNIQ